VRTTVILGAGFSKNSGLPVQKEIPALLIKENAEDNFENAVSGVLRRFMEDVFCYGKEIYPQLDDLLTCLDISISSGHHLGIKYSTEHLWAIKRFLVYRVFSILEGSFRYSCGIDRLVRFFVQERPQDTGFLVLNWDTVLERYFAGINNDIAVDYCNNGRNLTGDEDGTGKKKIKTIKVHGSSNWLYCDNCRTLLNDMDCSVKPIRKAGFRKEDFDLFDEMKGIVNENELSIGTVCNICEDNVSAHIATQCYRRSFRKSTFPLVWSEAEKMLADSEKWVFIGYSLPQADYEFKHLLKISEHKLAHKKSKGLSIDVVLLDSDNAIENYKCFFGDRVKRIFNGGIEEYINYLSFFHKKP